MRKDLDDDAPPMFDSCTLPLVCFETSSYVTSPLIRSPSSMLSFKSSSLQVDCSVFFLYASVSALCLYMLYASHSLH